MERLTTLSDAGSVRIGNDSFQILIPNGYGDGETNVLIIDEDDKLDEKARFFTIAEGEINIYNYDCASNPDLFPLEVIKTLKGRYGIYNLDGVVIFKKGRMRNDIK